MFNVPIEKVDPNLRRRAKEINFGIIYGITPFGLAKRLKITKAEAKTYMDSYFAKYSGIKAYMESTSNYAKEHHYVKNIFGRICHISGFDRPATRTFAERAAINAPLQSSAADIMKLAMSKLPPEIAKYLILQIHDELVFEVPEDKVKELTHSIKQSWKMRSF